MTGAPQMDNCPACLGSDLTKILTQEAIPAHSCLLMSDRQEAIDFPTGDMALTACRSCGFVFNAAFDLALNQYSESYEETQAFSAHFVEFEEALAQRWIDAYDIRNKTVLEIGCGKGTFLATMCRLGANSGIGIDPAVAPDRLAPEENAQIEWLAELYGNHHASIEADVVVCRHTLEHISPVKEFLDTIRSTLGDRYDVPVLFELPDFARVAEELAFWDIYYEHCSYFTIGSLARLFRRCGFDIMALDTVYDGQYLLIEAKPAPMPTEASLPAEDDLEATIEAIDTFNARFTADLDRRTGVLQSLVDAGKSVSIWGAGSKGVAFVTTLDAADQVTSACDINPYKAGKYLAGSGVAVVGPEDLITNQPDVVIPMNPVYTDEIAAKLKELGLQPELIDVGL